MVTMDVYISNFFNTLGILLHETAIFVLFVTFIAIALQMYTLGIST